MKNLIPAYVRVPVVFFAIFILVEYLIESGDKPAFIEYPEVSLFLGLVLLILIAIEAIVGSMENVMKHTLDEEALKRYEAEKTRVPEYKWVNRIYAKLTDSKPIEEEGEIILDHNYDGIKELDNSLPPWWLYGFYFTIAFSAVYLLKYHVFNGDGQYVELEKEIAEAKAEIEAYKKSAPDIFNIDELELLTDAASLNTGKNIFQANCVSCHQADGGGGIGPNLTDEYWILGGGIANVYNTVSEGGRDGKGMVPWKNQLRPAQIAMVSSYVLQFQGTTPAKPKAPEGEIWKDESSAGDASENTETNLISADSTAVDMESGKK